MRKLRIAVAFAASLALLIVGAPESRGEHNELSFDLKTLTDLYNPMPDLANLNNWRTYNAYNVVHFVADQLPNRQPNDSTSNDPLGDTNPRCKLAGDMVAGNCTYNHQREYLSWFETAYTDVLGEFGVTFRTYPFTSPGSTLANFATNSGSAFNKLAIVPGSEHPEDMVVIGSHFDGVDGSPYAAWDSTAGSGVLLRTAKLLADYWKQTGTRPSSTVIFAAWDAEEAGGIGSKDWVGTKGIRSAPNGKLPKDPEVTLKLYINHDPCGGHYPAMYHGSPVTRNPWGEKSGFVPMVIALHAPSGTTEERARMTAFNNSIPGLINGIFNNIDDTLPFTGQNQEPGVLPVFLSREEAAALGSEALEQESVLKITTNGLIGFTTDAEDFHPWIPTLNPYPDNIPRTTNPPGQFMGADAFFAYHTPYDNFENVVAQTHVDQTGLSFSKGLSMSWELCSMTSAASILAPTQGGLQAVNDDVVAYFENDNPNVNGGVHTFDASGSYRYTDTATREMDPTLEYSWDFGDGTTGSGQVVTHAFALAKGHRVTLTVTDPETLKSDTMSLKVGTLAI